MCHLHCNLVKLCCIIGLAVAFSTPLLFHQQHVTAEESKKHRRQEIALGEQELLQIKTLMFFCSKRPHMSDYMPERTREHLDFKQEGKEILRC